MATKDELQAQVTELEQRLAAAEQAGADAMAQAQAANIEAEMAWAEVEAAKGRTKVALPGTLSGEAFDVYCKIPAGMTFPLPGGRKIRLAGVPLARLMDSQGMALPGSGYGKTTVAAADWLYIRKTWNGHPVFRADNPVIFARAVDKGGDDQAVEQTSVTTGFEQIKVDGKDKAKGLKTEPAQK